MAWHRNTSRVCTTKTRLLSVILPHLTFLLFPTPTPIPLYAFSLPILQVPSVIYHLLLINWRGKIPETSSSSGSNNMGSTADDWNLATYKASIVATCACCGNDYVPTSKQATIDVVCSDPEKL
ncbi:hypothetical protein F5Y16DRAFT_257379 [Xylariaceae sp. FL0255]|nr:hypothetical protein F5Y16DRAFT_257379 [Xylariaceae sp. FL0255]